MLVLRRVAAWWHLWKIKDMSLHMYFRNVLSILNLSCVFTLENPMRCSVYYLDDILDVLKK